MNYKAPTGNTSDYYFCEADEDWYGEYDCEDFDQERERTVFFIVPKSHWDKTGSLYDGCVMCEVEVPEEFGEAMESCYEIEKSKEEGRQILLDAGFIEKKLF